MLIDFHVHIFPDKLAKGAVSSLAEKAGFCPFADGTYSATSKFLSEQGVDRCVFCEFFLAYSYRSCGENA